jgi:hypothetical protein
MKKLSFLLLLVSLLGAMSVAPHSAQAAAAYSGREKGVHVQSRSSSDFSSSSFQTSMRNLAADGANTVTLDVLVVQSNITSSDVHADSNTASDQSLRDGIAYIKSLGMQASLSLHDDPNDGQWRAFINPTDRATWFASYGLTLNHYADIAQASGAKELSIGTEMSSVTIPSYNSANTPGWLALISSVRSHFSGTLTYSAQHAGYMSDLDSLQFWPQLDLIGVSAYYPFPSNSATISQMESTWAQVDQNELSKLAATYGKKVLFAEVGYISADNALADPGSAFGNPGAPNMTIQANAYQALLEYWSNSTYMAGVDFWDWSSNPAAGGTSDNSYIIQNKPAEGIMKQWYSSTATSTPPTPTGPVTFAAKSTAASATIGKQTTFSANVTANQTASGKIVDLEIYNAAGQKIAQQAYENQNLSPTATPYTINWTPQATGTYTLAVGVFTANWQSNLYWLDNASNIVVSAPVVATTPTPTPTPTPAPSPTPAPATIDIWWPSNGATVTGTQPFKALINGIDQNSYNMYWQVDGDRLNQMTTVLTDGAHKQADVNVSGWNWKGPGASYTITFVAKDLAGNIIATKSTTITVGP